MPAARNAYLTPYGEFDLRRYPRRQQQPMQAWCAADTLLLEQVHELGVSGSEMLVANDEQGALCVALQPAALWTDSALAVRATQDNLKHNDRAPVPVVWSTAVPAQVAGCVVLRIPRQLPYFEYQLATLAELLPPGALVLAAGMDKHLSPRSSELLERYIGPTQRQRGRRKARLFSATRDEHRAPSPSFEATYVCEDVGGELCALPNVFSREKLDIGSRFLLQHLERLKPVTLMADLACGNGVLGLAACKLGLAQRVLFCDESAMAIESARRNAASLLPHSVQVSLHHGDGLLGLQGTSPGVILCNPPFHSNAAVDDFVGRRLLQQCATALLDGGQLCLVANRHLEYRPTLRRGFTQVEQLAQNSKFIVWLATK